MGKPFFRGKGPAPAAGRDGAAVERAAPPSSPGAPRSDLAPHELRRLECLKALVAVNFRSIDAAAMVKAAAVLEAYVETGRVPE